MANLHRAPQSYRENARRLRSTLVHAAGCTHANCASRDVLLDLIDIYRGPPVRVPRSLRGRFGSVIEGTTLVWDFSDAMSRKARNRSFGRPAPFRIQE